jgi:hypothetical protein
MGIFSRLFGNKGKIEWNGPPVSEMMNEDQYWSIIAHSLEKSEDLVEQEEALIDELVKLTPPEIIGFRLRTDQLLHDTYNSAMWCAAHLIEYGCSDDSFEYFRCWVISRGRDVYYKTKQDPDSLEEIVDNYDEFDFESFWYVANVAFEKKTGHDLYNFIDHDRFKMGEGHYPGFDFTWKEDDTESQRAICPKLYANLYE